MSSRPDDLREALAAARRTFAGVQAQLASGLARAVGDWPDERLDQVMQTPARRVVLEALFWQLSQRLDAAHPTTGNASIRWRITGRADGTVDVYNLEITEERCRVVRGPTDRRARLTITVEMVELVRLATGDSDPVRAYLRGGLALSGDLVLAAKLAWLVRGPTAGPPGNA